MPTAQNRFPFVGLNAVFGVRPATSQPGIKYLGIFDTPRACERACSELESTVCSVFTWHAPGVGGGYDKMCVGPPSNFDAGSPVASRCYGRTDGNWTTVPQAKHISGHRGDSVFPSSVQYTQSHSARFVHFGTWPEDGQLILTKGYVRGGLCRADGHTAEPLPCAQAMAEQWAHGNTARARIGTRRDLPQRGHPGCALAKGRPLAASKQVVLGCSSRWLPRLSCGGSDGSDLQIIAARGRRCGAPGQGLLPQQCLPQRHLGWTCRSR